MAQDNAQALGYATQTDFNAENLPADPFYGVKTFTNPPKLTAGSDHFKMNQPFNQTEVHVDLREGQVDWTLAITPDNILPVAGSALGAAVGGVCKAGVGPMDFLSVRFAEGLDQYWHAMNHLVNTLKIAFQLPSGFEAVISSLGPEPVVVASAWNTVPAIPGGYLPFRNWQCWINLDGTSACVRKLEVIVDNKLMPVICSASALPDTSTLAGLTPTRYGRGDAEVGFQLEILYTGNAGSEHEKFQQQLVSGPWQLVAIDPTGTAAFTIDLPRVGYILAEVIREPVPFDRLTGWGLLDTTLGAPLAVTMVP